MRCPRLHERQRGSAAIEFAFVFTMLFLILAGIVEFGRVFWYYNALTKATRSGARMLSLAERDTFASGTFIADAKSAVVTNANAANIQPQLLAGDVTVDCLDSSFSTIACDSGASAPDNVRVAITSYTVDIGTIVPFLSPTLGSPAATYLGIPLRAETTMRYMN